MHRAEYRSGFSLTEVLLAIGILAIGMVSIAALFPAAIHSSTTTSEPTVAAIVADEAFAKVRL
ncbi:MAG: type IV pilus modification PilV family protein [Planctomycetota bacterium]|jgi:prepilin-type N-terminal cleavage/methylation domain-containing protein